MFKKKKKIQNWFDGKYSKDEENIDISEEDVDIHNILGKKKDLIGHLKIEGFTKLKSISLKKLKLTSLEIINCSQLIKVELSELIELEGLCVKYCPELTKLDCSHMLTELTELDVNNLVELNCSNTSIKRLTLNLCPDIKILNCSNNNKLIDLDVCNCSKLEYIDCTDSKLTSLDLSNCPLLLSNLENKVNHPPNLDIIKERKTKNLIIVGRTGVGKSTLCNILSGSDVFDESGYSVSKTGSLQKKDFEWNATKYCVVDTVGIGNTRLSIMRVLERIAEGIYSLPDGISQVLIVVDERFATDEIKFEEFGNFIFESGIAKYITIVRTKFDNFRNEGERERDRHYLCGENEAIAEIIKSSNGIVYVNNPPINILDYDDNGNDDVDDKEIKIRINGKTREKSRNILLNHLEKVCQDKGYKVDTWDNLRSKIASFIPI